MPEYTFTTDWFSAIAPRVREVLGHLVGKDRIRVLEIGSYEGRSTCWFLDNILTGGGCAIHCVEPWLPYPDRAGDDWAAIEARWTRNTRTRVGDVAHLDSLMVVARHAGAAPDYDAAFIDGDHSACAVLRDTVFAWEMLKPGGVLMWDDYEWRRDDEASEDIPKTAINGWLALHLGKYEMVAPGPRLVAVRKL